MVKEVLTGIYKITNLDNGKMYVGQARDIYYRWIQHKSKLRCNNHENSKLQNSWNLHGENSFEFSIIEECDYEELNEREIYWIDKLRTYDGFEDCNGYNLTLGGEGTKYIHKVLRFDLSGNFIDEWQNGYEASRVLNINVSSIYGCCIKRLKRADKYIFCYAENYIDRSSLDWYFTDRKTAPVLQFDLNGNLINRWDSCSDSIKDLGYNPINCLLGTTKTCNGYIFAYEDESNKLTDIYFKNIRESFSKIVPKKIIQADKFRNIICRYESINDAERNGFSGIMVVQCCEGKRDNVKGYVFVYEKDFKNLTEEESFKRCTRQDIRKFREVIQLDMNDNIVNIFSDLSDAQNHGFIKSSISDCCNGYIDSYNGFKWKYGKENAKKGSKKVYQYDKSLNLISVFKSVGEASRLTEINASCISSNCNGKLKSTHGYIFSFDELTELKGA